MKEYIKSLKWIDYFFFCLIDPRRLVSLIDRKEGSPVLTGMLSLISATFFQVIALSMLGKESGFFYVKMSYGWIFYFICTLLQIIVMSSLWDMISQLRSHKGSIKLLIRLTGFSFFPIVFILPVMSVFTALHFAPWFFYLFFLLLLNVWQAMIIIQGISEIYQISFGESLLIFILPYVIFGLSSMFLTILFFINIFGYITNL
jgi:hypothetical protein